MITVKSLWTLPAKPVMSMCETCMNFNLTDNTQQVYMCKHSTHVHCLLCRLENVKCWPCAMDASVRKTYEEIKKSQKECLA